MRPDNDLAELWLKEAVAALERGHDGKHVADTLTAAAIAVLTEEYGVLEAARAFYQTTVMLYERACDQGLLPQEGQAG
jgi:hypothetical protein